MIKKKMRQNTIKKSISEYAKLIKLIKKLYKDSGKEEEVSDFQLQNLINDINEKREYNPPLKRLIQDAYSVLENDNNILSKNRLIANLISHYNELNLETMTVEQYRKTQMLCELALFVLKLEQKNNSFNISEEVITDLEEKVKISREYLNYAGRALEKGFTRWLTENQSTSEEIGKDFLNTPLALIKQIAEEKAKNKLKNSDIIPKLLEITAKTLEETPLTTKELQSQSVTLRDILERRVLVIGPDEIMLKNTI